MQNTLLGYNLIAVSLCLYDMFFEVKMNISVKNELKLLLNSVRFVVSSCLENGADFAINSERLSVVNLSLVSKCAKSCIIDFSVKPKSGLSFSVDGASVSVYRLVVSKAAGFVTVVNVLYRRVLGWVKKHLRVPEHHTRKKVLFKRQAVLACAGGLRL